MMAHRLLLRLLRATNFIPSNARLSDLQSLPDDVLVVERVSQDSFGASNLLQVDDRPCPEERSESLRPDRVSIGQLSALLQHV